MKMANFKQQNVVVNPERAGASRMGFTIVELLVTIFIFSSVMILASSSLTMSFLSGRTNSAGSLEANRSLSLVLDNIGQKMANASGKETVSGTTIYGFRESAGLLTIALKDGQCAYFGRVGDTIKMSQQACSLASPGLSGLSEVISSPTIKITGFKFLSKNEYLPPANTNAPYLMIEIKGRDTKTNDKDVTLQTTYSIPKYVYNRW